MRKEMIKIFFLTFAALFIAATTSSVAPSLVRSASVIQRPEACDYDWGLGKWLNQSVTIDDQTVPLSIKLKCKNNEKEIYVKNDNLHFDHSSNVEDMTY